MREKNKFYFLLSLPSLLITALIFIFPLVSVFTKCLSDKEELISVFKSAYTLSLLLFTVRQAFLSAIISTLLALPFALFFSHYTFPCRRFVLTLSDTAFVLPSVIVVLAFVIWYGNSGILNTLLSALTGGRVKIKILYSFSAIILAHVYLNFPLAFSFLTGAFINAGEREENAALSLGVSRMKVFFTITVGKIKGSILSIILLIFLFCFPSFLIVMTLGGSPKYYTLEAEIYRRAYVEGNLSSSSSLALLSFIFTAILIVITSYGRKEKKIKRIKRSLRKAEGKARVLALVLSLLILLFVLPPLFGILYRSFFNKDGVFSLSSWTSLISDKSVRKALLSSLIIALISSYIVTEAATALSISSVRRKTRLPSFLSSLPMAAGSVTLGLGFSFLESTLNGGKAVSFIFTLLAHTTVLLPFAIRTILPSSEKLSDYLYSSALSLSQGKMKCYRKVEKPMLKIVTRRSFAFSFALSLGETNATLALGGGKITTLPILIYKMIGMYNYSGAAALSVVLLTLSLIVFAISERGGDNGLS